MLEEEGENKKKIANYLIWTFTFVLLFGCLCLFGFFCLSQQNISSAKLPEHQEEQCSLNIILDNSSSHSRNCMDCMNSILPLPRLTLLSIYHNFFHPQKKNSEQNLHPEPRKITIAHKRHKKGFTSVVC